VLAIKNEEMASPNYQSVQPNKTDNGKNNMNSFMLDNMSIIQKLNQHSIADLKEMYFEMLPVIEHNYEHFYGKFKQILVNEMLDNFTSNLDLWNSCNLKKYNYKKVLDINRIKMILHH
jgi:hypothetical protein